MLITTFQTSSQLLPAADKHTDLILQQYSHARSYLEQTLEKEAEEKIRRNERSQVEVVQKIEAYNQAVSGINTCLQAMQLYEHLLPVIGEGEILPISTDLEFSDFSLNSNDTTNGMVETH